MLEQMTKDWEWLTFLARYCAGKNIAKSFCDDIRWWALGIAALLVAAIAWWIWGKVARTYENWNERRLAARVADADTMKKYVWSGHDAHLTSSDQRAQRKSER